MSDLSVRDQFALLSTACAWYGVSLIGDCPLDASGLEFGPFMGGQWWRRKVIFLPVNKPTYDVSLLYAGVHELAHAVDTVCPSDADEQGGHYLAFESAVHLRLTGSLDLWERGMHHFGVDHGGLSCFWDEIGLQAQESLLAASRDVAHRMGVL